MAKSLGVLSIPYCVKRNLIAAPAKKLQQLAPCKHPHPAGEWKQRVTDARLACIAGAHAGEQSITLDKAHVRMERITDDGNPSLSKQVSLRWRIKKSLI
jgi:hypothetical protein